MTKSEIQLLLNDVLEPYVDGYDSPTIDEWRELERRFNTVFSAEFKAFVELMSIFSFPGDIYNVPQAGRTNGNDTIVAIYESEREVSNWPEHLIPFYGIGNGDYFAINAHECENSGVYYRRHEDGGFDRYSESFEDWLRRLPPFLKGVE